MSQFLYLAAVALALSGYCYAQEEIIPEKQQIKMVDTGLWYIDRRYINEVNYTVTEHNETYSNVHLYWDVNEDLPEDVLLQSNVFATDSSFQNPRLLLQDETPICQESEHRQLLPKFLVVDKSLLNEKCIKGGVHELEDMGQFRFEVLIPNLPAESKYYKVNYRIATPKRTILKASFFSKFGGYTD